jgi:hypothetical protein
MTDTQTAFVLAPGAIYRHKKHSTEYELIGIGKMQSANWLDCVPSPKVPWDSGKFTVSGTIRAENVDMREVAIYRSVTDPAEIWVRPIDEFKDGRFELSALPNAAAKGVRYQFVDKATGEPLLPGADHETELRIKGIDAEAAIIAKLTEENARLNRDMNDWRNGDLQGVVYHMEAFRERANNAEITISELKAKIEELEDRIVELSKFYPDEYYLDKY